VRLIFLNWFPVTGGAMGIKNVPVPNLGFVTLDSNIKYFYFALFWVVVTYVSMNHLNRSKYGRAFKAIRDDDLATLYSGVNVPKYKILNFAIASVFTGLAGALQVHYTGYCSPLIYTLDESIFLLQMPILGGLGSMPGSIVGTIILVILPEISRTFYQYRLMFIGVLMVIMMTWAPNGLLGPGGLGSWVKANFLQFRLNGYRFKRKEV
ncbi:MAG: branched-chain amino acid ABC transporter permease, partial [Dehalobacterium sp.]